MAPWIGSGASETAVVNGCELLVAHRSKRKQDETNFVFQKYDEALNICVIFKFISKNILLAIFRAI